MTAAPPIVTLTTDFGTSDEYVGALRGAVLSACPRANVVDISHDLPPQDLVRAAYVLEAAAPVFPEGTVHVVVVDPGVGTERAAIAARAGGHLLVGPDNGVLVPLIARLGGEPVAYRIENPALMRASISSTFHGRDIFAPVGGYLAAGVALEAVGPRLPELVALAGIDAPRADGDAVRGAVVTVDHFGNLVTNIPRELLPARPSVRIGDRTLDGLVATYGAAPPGADVVALVGSRDTLEVATPNGSAAARLGLGVGAAVEVSGS